MTLQALIFDVDGTLADTERDGHRPAFNQAFGDAGLDWQWDVDLYGKLLAVTGGKDRMKHYVETFRPDYRRPDDFDELVAELHRTKTRIYADLAARGGIPMRPGVEFLPERCQLIPAHYAVEQAIVVTVEFVGICHGTTLY